MAVGSDAWSQEALGYRDLLPKNDPIKLQSRKSKGQFNQLPQQVLDPHPPIRPNTMSQNRGIPEMACFRLVSHKWVGPLFFFGMLCRKSGWMVFRMETKESIK